MTTRKTLVVGGVRIRRGEIRDIRLKISETYTGEEVFMPIRAIRAARPGPVLFLTAAIHGDEINGTGIIRDLAFGDTLHLKAGSVLCVPVVDVFGFESHDRYMPDRRDLNRFFPGSPRGSLSSRFAHVVMEQVVRACDYGIDLHSAAANRTNYPNVRGDLRTPGVVELAEAFGCELIVNGKGPEGSLRRAACEAGVPTIILEAGEALRIEPHVVEIGAAGVRNVLIHLGMLDGVQTTPRYQARIHKTTWVRAELGGLLRFHVRPGDLVEGGQPIATNESVFGSARSVLISPCDGVVLGMTTHPAVKPGEPVCHIAVPGRTITRIRRALHGSDDGRAPAALREPRRQRPASTPRAQGKTPRRS